MNTKELTPTQIKRRKAYARLLASLKLPSNQTLAHPPEKTKQKPGVGVMRTV